LLRVIVRGRLPDPVESYAVLPASDAERRDIANGCLQTGNRLAKSDPYRALQQYRIALAVLEPMKPQGTLYVKATEKVREMETLLQQKYTELASSINKARAAKDLDQELSYLQALLQLIPDSNDPRHQKAQVRIKTAIVEMEQSLKR
jgi:hypothetical protein